MYRNFFRYLILIVCLIGMQTTISAQELAVATGSEDTYGGGGAYDGTNYLLSIINVVSGTYNIELQFIGPGPVLSGSRISTGKIGSGAKLAFDGTNYLMVWTDPFPFFASGDTNGIGNLYGQIIDQSGQMVGSTFDIATGVNIKFGQGRGSLSYNDTTYFITYVKGGPHQDYLYGQPISKTGVLLGSPVQISSNYAREHAISFDRTNYLVAWCEGSGVDEFIYGQLVSETGQLIGNNFLVDGSTNKSDNPLAMAFDGNQYYVLFHDQAADSSTWNIYGRFVSISGNVSSNRILVCDSTKSPAIPSIAFDGTEYLITWVEFKQTINVWGRYFDTDGAPLDSEFIVFDTLGGKFAFGGVGGYIANHFILGATRVDPQFTDCDVYVKGLDPLTSIDIMKSDGIPLGYKLNQNYPNPFNPSTRIRYELPTDSKVTLIVYDILGRQVAELVNGELRAGYHEVTFNANNLASGIYFYRMTAGSFTQVNKMLLMK